MEGLRGITALYPREREGSGEVGSTRPGGCWANVKEQKKIVNRLSIGYYEIL